jgi:hypothetical protein
MKKSRNLLPSNLCQAICIILQEFHKDIGIRCKRPKLELLHGSDYKEGKERVENYKHVALALKKRSDVSI